MNIKNYLEKNWIYDNEKFFEFFESEKVQKSLEINKKEIRNYKILWFLFLSIIILSSYADTIHFYFKNFLSLEEIISIIFLYIIISIPIIFYQIFFNVYENLKNQDNTKIFYENKNIFKETLYYKKSTKNYKKINYLEIFLNFKDKNFWNFKILKKFLKNYIIFFILLFSIIWLLFFIIFNFNNFETSELIIYIIFLFLILYSLYFTFFEKNKISSWNENFNKKFMIISEDKNIFIQKEIQKKILELDKIIKTDFEIIFSWNQIILKINLFSDIPLSLEKKLLRNYILFKKCEKIFE